MAEILQVLVAMLEYTEHKTIEYVDLGDVLILCDGTGWSINLNGTIHDD